MMSLKLPKEQKELLIQRVQAYFIDEREEELGDLAAEFLLDHMITLLGPVIYNQAIEEALAVIEQRNAALEEDLHAIKKSNRSMK